MANAETITAFFKDLPVAAPIDDAAVKETWNKAAKFTEALAGIALDAANKTASVSSTAGEEMVAGLRDVTKAQPDATGYANALVEFGNAQAELLRKNAEALTEIAKQAQSETTELMMAAGKDSAEVATTTVKKTRAAATRKAS